MSTRPASILMLSGGLDSTVAAFMATETTEPRLALTFDYGQRARRRELAAGYALAQIIGVPHRTVFLPFFREFEGGALTDPNRRLPEPEESELDDLAKARGTAGAVWVPNRNGVFVAVAAAWAESIGASVLVVGFNAEEARTFPDNGGEFVAAQNAALELSTSNGVKVFAPTLSWTKEQIVRHAKAHDWPLELVWSCYEGDDQPCGRCESCRRFLRAVEAAEAREWLTARRPEKRR